MGEHLLQWEDDFLLLEESGGALSEEALGDLPLVLGGSPSLLEELGMSHEVQEDSYFFLFGTAGIWFLLRETCCMLRVHHKADVPKVETLLAG